MPSLGLLGCSLAFLWYPQIVVGEQLSIDSFPTKHWQLDDDAQRPCNIARYTEEDLLEEFSEEGMDPRKDLQEPIIVLHPPERNSRFRSLLLPTELPKHLPPSYRVTLGNDRTYRTNELVHEIIHFPEILPNRSPTLEDIVAPYFFGNNGDNPESWEPLLVQYTFPPCKSCHSNGATLSLGLGSKGSGHSWHSHNAAFCETLLGRKHWFFLSPSDAANATSPADLFAPTLSSRSWREFIYPTLATAEAENSGPKVWECTVLPTETIFFPDDWHHSVVNLDNYTAFITGFITDFTWV